MKSEQPSGRSASSDEVEYPSAIGLYVITLGINIFFAGQKCFLRRLWLLPLKLQS